jgi:hypothetical protein
MGFPIDNNCLMRLIVAVSAFVAAYLIAWLVVVLLASGSSGGLLLWMPWLIAAGAAWMAWRKAGEQPATMSDRMIAWGSIGVFGGFVVGFFGPLVFAPEANQGPLLGLFITAPAGGLVGVLGAWWWSR